MTKAIIAVPMGDPAGIGPEITVKSFLNSEVLEAANSIVVGDKKIIDKALEITGTDLQVNVIKEVEEADFSSSVINLIDLNNVDTETFKFGEVQKQCGKAAFEYIEHAIKLAMDGKVDALATTPINKESLKAAEVPFIGHTEMLEELTNSHDPLTMFQVRSLRIFFLTRHLSVKAAIDQMTAERVHDYIKRSYDALIKLGVKEPKLAVAGLNPHSGEGGLFGNEEIDEITPGIERAREEGYEVAGPVPADSVFFQALNGRYDAVISLYHDQGHIAAKMTDFHKTISITNGLPFLRSSVDHGTAFDIAGQNIASSESMEECIKLAGEYALTFRN
ncbi:4-hydroxythreonine-4-phosphate dehydrogenase [Jeotgalicoccus coquinae]|uniref:4-hydroxythreonine-4-phosphate dehydrogenase n=1 Tax=Jeotgalicoccus coquinae TaxID=709509 RepID=A0A6V7RNR1_9STAP|nr:4-hydroxythreonine-4-phosphate dehydrogenase PdxA [Jeotgalicoccus coquinae]MBB6422111.1 4-hydroxythreonine-4-phosphate dehydrogenase [Jeotgalicoccus coquinae]GGE18553.1 4-hydroxythreonine-4-phosphate dehydrogenase [Jeotgalicoccus coquinae]CAD2079703.1 D-erythronate 4-phosphate dehydrogenase [Jeotgalicoccus coquinae]